ncbi:MAG: GDP-mannose 4,6-dehydratase [Prochlorococcus marinus CUG1437]|nr:GDP-mannose 4,6-dehydratase [Prochlorococcus marinus CUG1437]
MKKIIVTGGLGFIGYNLIKKFLDDEFIVYSIDSGISGTKNKLIESNKLKHFNLDLSNKNKAEEIISESDLVIHLAAKGNVVESVDEPIINFNNNVKTTLNLLEILKKSENCKKIIFSSTGGALMGNTKPPVKENSPPKPISPYGASKLACEGYINAYSECYGIKSIIFRFGNVYGPYGCHKKGVVNKFIRNAISNKKHTVNGSLESSRDYIHVFDICDAIKSGINYIDSMDSNNEVFHLANFEEVTLSKLINTIDIVSLKKSPFIVNSFRKGEVFKNFSSNEKAFKSIGFKPKYNLEKGIKELYQWTLENEF